MLNRERKISLTGCISYMVGGAGFATLCLGKQNTAEMPCELHVWHARRKCDHVGIQKII